METLKGDMGEMGLEGAPGKDGKDGEIGLEGMPGKDGKDGKNGKNGKDGKDGLDADPKEVIPYAEKAVKAHEKKIDHTLIHAPDILGTKEVDESNANVGTILTIGKDGKLIYQKPKEWLTRTDMLLYGRGGVTVTELDGSPNVHVSTIKFSNGSVTDNGDGSVSVSSGGGGGGTPGGSTTQVQYNNAGAFAGITGATTDGATLTLVTPTLGVATATRLGVGAAADAVNLLTFTQPAASSGTPNALVLAGGAHTALTASTEASDINFNLARTVQFATGAITNQRAVRVQAPTYSFVGASTITNAGTFTISGAPIAGTNATITNPYALWVQAGNMKIGSGTAGSPLAAIGQDGIEMAYSNNTTGGVGLVSVNTSNGASAYVGTALNNDSANGSTYIHFAGIYLNSSTYNDPSFGTIGNIASQYLVYGTDGPTTIGTSLNGSYINFFIGGAPTPALANEVGRWTTAGLTVGLAGTLSGLIKLPGLTSGTVSLGAQDVAGTYTLKLPNAQGAAGTYPINNGSGVLYWAPAPTVFTYFT